jgi:hypothetical protein
MRNSPFVALPFISIALACGPTQAAELSHAQACSLIPSDSERLACYDGALNRSKRLAAFQERPASAAAVAAEFPEAPAPKYPLFLRASTSLSAKNEDPAELSLQRTGGDTTGSAKAALIWVKSGSLDVFDLKNKNGTPYLGVGFKRDKSDPSKPVSGKNVRGGYWVAWNPLSDKGNEESALAGDFGLQLDNDSVTGRRTAVFEVDIDGYYRWQRIGVFGRQLSRQIIRLGVTPYVDRVLRDPKAGAGSSHGLEFRIGASSTISQWLDLGWPTPESLNWLSTHARELGGLQRRSTEHSLSLNWLFRSSANGQQGLKLERSIGGNFRAGEDAVKAGKTSLKFTASYGK